MKLSPQKIEDTKPIHMYGRVPAKLQKDKHSNLEDSTLSLTLSLKGVVTAVYMTDVLYITHLANPLSASLADMLESFAVTLIF